MTTSISPGEIIPKIIPKSTTPLHPPPLDLQPSRHPPLPRIDKHCFCSYPLPESTQPRYHLKTGTGSCNTFSSASTTPQNPHCPAATSIPQTRCRKGTSVPHTSASTGFPCHGLSKVRIAVCQHTRGASRSTSSNSFQLQPHTHTSTPQLPTWQRFYLSAQDPKTWRDRF